MVERAKPSYFKNAVLHPLNFMMLGTAATSAALTGSWIPLVVGAGAEVVWMLTHRLFGGQRDFAEWRHAQSSKQDKQSQEQVLLRSGVKETDRRRFLELDRLAKDIRGLVSDNPSLEGELLAPELDKIDGFVSAFLRAAADVARLERFAEDSDLDTLEGKVRSQQGIVDQAPSEEAKAEARQNLELLTLRLDKAVALRGEIREGRSQLNLVENTIQLLRDQIVTMRSTEELSARLEEVVETVGRVETVKRETEALDQGLDPRVARREPVSR